MNAYNPRDWSMNGAANGSHVRHSRMSFSNHIGMADSVTGMETSMPSPPPPYLPASASVPMSASNFRYSPSVPQAVQSQRTSPTNLRSGYSPPACLSATGPLGSVSNTPLQQTSPTLFPPPPSSQRDRSGSRARGVMNNISAWASRHRALEPAFSEPNIGAPYPVSSDSLTRVSINLPLAVGNPIIHSTPPATRRAVSVGYPVSAIPPSREASRTRHVSGAATAWEPGMPLPPPPPGPPPGGRSQSLGRSRHASGLPYDGSVTPPHLLRNGNALGSIPPTPVGWSEENDATLYSTQAPSQNGTKRASEEIAKLAQRRDGSPKSIRERRTESRARSRHGQEVTEPGGSRAGSVSREGAKPADLVLSTDSNLLVRRRRVTTSPLEHRNNHSDSQSREIEYSKTGRLGEEKEQIDKLTTRVPMAAFVLTPPFSPETLRRNSGIDCKDSTSVVPNDDYRPRATQMHMIHPIAKPPTVWSRIEAQNDASNDYSEICLLRYKSLLRAEQEEADDSKRLMLFAKFMVKEFQLRSMTSPEVFASNTDNLRQAIESIWQMPKQHVEDLESRPGPRQRKAPMALNTTNLPDSKYEPILSPILSTVMSKEASEGSDARGRPSSRWWETSTSSESIGCIDSRKLERSKRESKYMSVVHDSQFEPQAQTAFRPTGDPTTLGCGISMSPDLQNTYPQEKVGWHEQEVSPQVEKNLELLSTPRPHKVDISRLVNLPPPFPRRHPALSGSHPKLTSYRTVLQIFRDRSMLETHQSGTTNACQLAYSANDTGLISDQLSRRINEATVKLNELCRDLTAAITAHDPTLPQEEGDEEPELLEKLTIAKRIFEAREQIYRDQLALQNAFTVDSSKRSKGRNSFRTVSNHDTQLAYAKLAARRHREFQQIVQGIILGGIEDQLSAFWDIAPPLVDVVRKVPLNLRNFHVDIPEHEFVENPAYDEFPLQYFYSLLIHAEKSTYQFIDSQINLFCLLHEVKTTVANSRCNLIEAQWVLEGRDGAVMEQDLQAMRSDADLCLTKELQGQVAVVEEQWKTALGSEVGDCKRKVKEYLQGTGGWIEGLGEYL